MEVHAHTHTARKKWTHYFWEFLMLFLAVFCGFLAEYQLEHTIEHQREKKYMESLIQDLREDTAFIRKASIMRTGVCLMIDTVITLLKSPARNTESGRIYYLVRKIPYSEGRFRINTKTYEQMKNSGNLRLIRKPDILRSITNYYYVAHNAESLGPLEMNFENRHDLYLALHKLFDASVFHSQIDPENPLMINMPKNNPDLMSNDKLTINEICMRLHFHYGTQRVIIADNEMLRVEAEKLIVQIQKEYHLK